jgi:hypothetical protein
MMHAGRCSLCLRGKTSTHLALPFMTVKIISIDNLEINKICGFFMRNPGFVFLTASVLRPSFERTRGPCCLMPLVKAIRVRVQENRLLFECDSDGFAKRSVWLGRHRRLRSIQIDTFGPPCLPWRTSRMAAIISASIGEATL